jgi:hypothetical protein
MKLKTPKFKVFKWSSILHGEDLSRTLWPSGRRRRIYWYFYWYSRRERESLRERESFIRNYGP